MRSSRLVRSLLVAVALGAGFVACAQGTQLGMGGMGGRITGTAGDSGAGGMTEAGPPPGGIGSPCPDGMCANGTCTLLGNTKYCTTACPPTCPQGTHCSVIGGNPICAPDVDQCAKCGTSADCALPSSNCLTAPLGDAFCAQDCSVDGMCPNGYVCTSMGAYGALDGGASDGGSDGGTKADGGASDGGAKADGGAGDGGTDAGGSGIPNMANMWCVPDDGASCPCTHARDGVTNTCYVTNTNGSCAGSESCTGSSASWTACSATTPGPEVCNGKDDNCDGQIDNGNPNALCAFMGAPPTNGNWACANGACGLGTCQPGWAAYPTSSPTTGCTCAVDTDEPNNTCAQATLLASVQSVGGAPLVITGTLSNATDVDVYTFNTVDTAETGTNSYHVSIAFTSPAPNTEFLMDVIRGNPCSDTPTGSGVGITSYDWCVNGTGTQGGVAIGEAPCDATTTDEPHCTDHTSAYFLRVYRAAGVTGTCTKYSITVTGGGGTCDVTAQCM